MSECIGTDVLILGCGVAGGTVALCLADAGIPVTLVTRAADPNDSNTNLAQGGIIYKGHEDSPALAGGRHSACRGRACESQGRYAAGRRRSGLVERILLERLGRRVRPCRRWGFIPGPRRRALAAPHHPRGGCHRQSDQHSAGARPAGPSQRHPARRAYGHRPVNPSAPLARIAWTSTPRCPAWERMCWTRPRGKSSAAWRGIRCWRPEDSGRFSCVRRILLGPAATESPLPIGLAHASSTWSSCSSTRRPFSIRTRRASSSPKPCAAKAGVWCMPTARLSCSTTTRSGATWPRAMWWRAVSTTRCSVKMCPTSFWICVRTSPSTAFASTFLPSTRSV